MKIKKSYLIYLLCLFPFLEMPRWGYVPEINRLFLVAKLLSATYILAKVILSNLLNKLDILFIVYSTVLVISTIINRGEVVEAVSNGVAIIAPMLLVEYYMNKISISQLLKPFVYIQMIYTLITGIQLLRVPFHIFRVHGLRSMYTSLDHDKYGYIYALGEPKRFVFVLLPMLMFALLIWRKQSINSQVKLGFCFCCSIFVVTYSWGVSAMLSLLGVVLYLFFVDKFIIFKKYIDIWKIWIGYLISNALLVGTNILVGMRWFAALFGKSSNLSGRTYIWAKAISYIKDSFLYGYGIDGVVVRGRFDNLAHVHNLLLNILYQGGIVLFIIFTYICFIVFQKLYQYRERNAAVIITGALLGYFVLALTDTTDSNMLFLIFVLGYSIDKNIFNTTSGESTRRYNIG